MGTRSLVSGGQSKSTPDRRMGFGQVDVKKEFRIKKETPDDEIKEYAETAMNELLGWYGYDKVDSRDTQGLNLHHFAANKTSSTGRSPSDAESSDAEGTKNVGSPARRDPSCRGSPSLTEQGAGAAGCIICSWCNKVVSHKMFSLKTPGGEKSFCSEMCFSQCRRANFKRNKTCDWCRHIRHTVNYVDFQDGEHQLQFCSDKCLNQYKMNIFCKETEAHLQLHPHLQGLGSSGGTGNGNASVRLITPELWLRDCRSESPLSDRSASPTDNSSPIEIKVVMRPPSEIPQVPLKLPPPSLEITKLDKRDKSRKNNLLTKTKRQTRSFLPPAERRGSSSSPRSGDSLTPPKPLFPPPLLPLNGTQISSINPHPNLPPEPPLLRPPFLPLTLPCFPPSPILSPNHPYHPHLHPHSYEHILRPPILSPPSPSAPTPTPNPTTTPNPSPINPPPPPNRPSLPPPPRSLLPPVTILVPYPIALAIPIPLPIPIPIPLLPPKKPNPQHSPSTPSSPAPTPAPPPDHTPPHPPSPPPPPAEQHTTVPRPLRKRKRVTDLPPPEEDAITKRKTVPV